jgi:mono/diheme cytochrome c family protein
MNSRVWRGFVFTLVLGGTMPAVHGEELASYRGAELFKRFCASCHGDKGRGDGPVAPFFKVSPPDLTRIARRHGGEFPAEQVRKIIDGREVPAPHGAREMPVWGLEFYFANPNNPQKAKEADVLVGKLVEYVRSLQQ